ncbi:MAG: dockerin type I domain-containing protein, partial [Planctomycetota bacterium]
MSFSAWLRHRLTQKIRRRVARRLRVRGVLERRLLLAESLEARLPMAADFPVHTLPVCELPAPEDPTFSARWGGAAEIARQAERRLGVDFSRHANATLRAIDPPLVVDPTFDPNVDPPIVDPPVEPLPERFVLEIDGQEWDVVWHGEQLEFTHYEVTDFHNVRNANDTNDDGVESPLDALIVINYLNSSDIKMLPSRASGELVGRFIDVNGDRWVTPLDALRVVNRLNDDGGSDAGSDDGSGNIGDSTMVPGDDGTGDDGIVDGGTGDDSTGSSFSLTVAEQVTGSSSASSIPLRDAAGNGLIVVQYDGTESATVGVLLSWQYNEPPYGIGNPGKLTSDLISLNATFYPTAFGTAWIHGTVPAVNQILASVEYLPAVGYSAPEGVKLNVSAFLYIKNSGSKEYESGALNVIVTPSPLAPITAPDFFTIDPANFRGPLDREMLDNLPGPIELDVLANDRSVTGGSLRLVSVQVVGHREDSWSVNEDGTKVLFTPLGLLIGYRWLSYQTATYVVSDELGNLAQGTVAISPPQTPKELGIL